METHIAATPFGARPMSLALLAAQRESRKNLPEAKAVDKWLLYKNLCEGKTIIGVSDRSLAVLSALLSFYPDSELSEEGGLIVFPSNKQLSLRAHGMPDPTLRRHLAALLTAGLLLRRDSPNGKRYAHKGRAGEIEEAFGFSLAPLLVRADEIAAAAEQVRADNAALRLTRERVTLQRRDIYKLIEVAFEEGLAGNWKALWSRFRAVVDSIPRRASLGRLEAILAELSIIREEVDNMLNCNDNDEFISGNDAHIDRQQSESNPDSHFEFEPAFEKSGARVEPGRKTIEPAKGFPLGLVLKACPDIEEYAAGGISNWRELMATAAQVRGYLGISPSAYADALDVIGQENTAVVIACILQRAQHIHSAGGYLRSLTDKATAGEFSVGPMLMAALKTNAGTARMTG
ncbi:replication initiation protein RepC (plasmid) [Aminobacter sp. SR38]|jgi:replication initiation protein RepC|uniref:plasmid replication protein RepC n=1 Tax=Aminobacter sp. SR38 TaxID=2774562 RepID=UPI001780581C|nr:plasmid replication protein RepC [Aminobacter sp. SR38]QOF75050.1 replication initiation protein RepC [Aminobacter sp. SR38]